MGWFLVGCDDADGCDRLISKQWGDRLVAADLIVR
jgi:hypothetical protein